ncbi:MAG TPA: NAD(P)/FAD-dependent oxidoreductase [Terriglobales bacterium]|jgi:flavin-dependent dehydrogenase|nr:NAD(P)/FAD-dependent oxidoreductase [Terriglobales bacterium]
MLYDLTIVGGGPAGTSAAISAARRGARVLVLERGRFPRHKVCGEFVSAESLSLLAHLLNGARETLLHDALRIPRARIFVDGRKLQTSVNPAAASIARVDLDAALWQSAQIAGADARQQVTVQSIAGSGPFLLRTSDGEFETRSLVNASGRWSNLNLSSIGGSGVSGEKWLGVKAHFAEPSSQPSVDLYFFNGGYCGVQPVSVCGETSATGRVNASAMVRSDVASTLPEVFAQHPALRDRAQNWTSLSEPVSTSPLIFRDPQPTQNSILMVGDAAGFVDPFVGDGISLALRSGALAATCLMEFFAGRTSLPGVAARYHQLYTRELLPVFRASSTIRLMLKLPRSVRKPLLYLLQGAPAITRYAVRKTR